MVMGDPGGDRERLEHAAGTGDTRAMFKLGVMFADTDPGLARRWYGRAAQAGDAYAQSLVEASHLDRGSYAVIFVADRDGNVIGPRYPDTTIGHMVMRPSGRETSAAVESSR